MNAKNTVNSRATQRGQLMIEFFLYVSVFLFIIISGYFVVSFIQNSEVATRESLITKELGESFKNAITLSVRAGEGFTYEVSFPKNLLSKPYNLKFNETGGLMVLSWEGSYGNISYPYKIPLYDYEFKGCSTLASKKMLVSNACKSVISIYNDGEKLIITQPA